MTTRFRWEKCPCCGEVLPFHEGQDEAIAHLLACAKKQQLEAHPEVNDEDQLLLEVKEVQRLEDGFNPDTWDDMGKPSNK